MSPAKVASRFAGFFMLRRGARRKDMKRSLAKILVIAMLAAALAVAFSACNDKVVTYAVNYDETGYVASETFSADGITALDIEWLAGEVSVTVDENATAISLGEFASANRGEDLVMRLLQKDGTLFVKCAKAGSYQLKGGAVKTLNVTVPPYVCLDSLNVKGISVTVRSHDVMFKRASVDTHSGAVSISTSASNFASYTRALSVKTISGNVWLNLTNNVVAEDDADGIVKISTSSGDVDVKVNGSVPRLQIKTVDGSQSVQLNKTVFDLDLDTLSGGVEVVAKAMPLSMSARADLSTLTLKFNVAEAFDLVTDAQLAVSTVDISKGEPQSEGRFRYVYTPAGYESEFRSKFSVLGKGSVLNLESIKV